MITQNNRQITKKRTLKKIRAQFLHKKDDPEEETDVNPDTRHLSEDTMCVLVPAMGLIETNRKVSVGPQNFKLFCKSSDFMIEPRPFNRVARIDFSAGADINTLPWDYTLKRLLSYGNLELATLARRFDMFRNAASRMISELHDSLTKDDPISRKMWNEMKHRAKTLCEEAEKNRIFFKVVFLITKDIQQTLSNSYSEGLLEEMGYSPETFLKWTAENGMPNLFTYDSPAYAGVIRAFLGLAYITTQVFVSPVEEAFLYDSKKARKKILVQNVAALEPISSGFLFHSYFVGKEFSSKDLKVKKKCAILEDRDLNFEVSSPTKNSNSYENEVKNKRVKATSLGIV